MSILIDVVRISGFRGIKELEVFLPRVSVFVGQNNAGKTSVIKALQLALGDYSRYLSEEDFHINQDDSRSEQILIDTKIVPLTEEGAVATEFSDDWLEEFGDKIRQDAVGNQFLAIRTVAKPDTVRGGFLIERYTLDQWVDDAWVDVPVAAKNRFSGKLRAIQYVSIDAQRDLHSELKERSSFIGKVLSTVEYDSADIADLEGMIKEVNQQAIDKSEPLTTLKKHLNSLNDSFDGEGKAELSPFPKKVRDLSKRFSVHFGQNESNSFSMEYHGMGTRSWASMLTVKAMVELSADSHEKEVESFFPVVAAEEPEAHLHVNAQRTLFKQMSDMPGQVIISTHSPYIASLSNLENIRCLRKSKGAVVASQLIAGLDSEDIKTLRREVMRLRGDILFSKALILFEGVSEEQILPAMFERYFDCSPFEVGVSCIAVGGKNYKPFIKMAGSFGIPVFIVSDNDGTTKTEVTSHIVKTREETSLELGDDSLGVSYLGEGNDIEAELVSLDMLDEIKKSIVLAETRGRDIPGWVAAKTREVDGLNQEELVEKMRGMKAAYAGFLAEVILANENEKQPEQLIPLAVREAFDKVKEWTSHD
ncbi:ATP-dependent nuclease [Vibrio parahaemolyticus]|uniref:ATP-dependent nuclease n=2 Tax=Vibrio parahaemolyticus TaxID=670 RepID=UPI001121C95A|nr:AAA family ATPase [Vibrio parahaemolyticus]TOE05156.1 ATP-dependent endonuclease [Vibrio parahaemolyticus]TOE10486.1 ATP-dependent endonuclease [Vibrio parahaemolyticus]TOE16561.1 ATP-dependent endonuclease [Vibrio parahaemolyticus]